MIVFSKKRVLATQINTITLPVGEDYLYVHRDVYDKAVILADRHTLSDMMLIVEPEHNKAAIDFFYENVPQPLHILAPFLGLVDGQLEDDIEELIGAMHAITMVLDVRGYSKLRRELRKGVTLSLSVKEEYELAWERFFALSIPYEERDILNIGTHQPVYATYAQPNMYAPQPQPMYGGEPIQAQAVQSNNYEDLDPESRAYYIAHPAWQETGEGSGIFFNEETDECAFITDEQSLAEDQAFYDTDPLRKTPEEDEDDEEVSVEKATIIAEIGVTQEEKTVTRGILNIRR